MPRRKKNTDNITELTEQQVFDVFEFAKNMYGMWQNVYTPELVASRLKDVTMNPMAATEQKITDALNSPKENEQTLISISEFFELTDMLYKRQIKFFGNLLSFDLSYVCTNIQNEDDYKSSSYKKDLAKVEEFLDKFNHKKEFKKVMRQLFRQEAFYSIFRDDGEVYTLQELPQSYCKITGYWDYGILFDFNMYWFIQPGVSLDMYPPCFKQYFKRVFGNGSIQYNPAAKIDKRTGEYVYWVQTDPVRDNVWAWKLNPEIATNVPFFSPLFPDLVIRPLVRNLQKNKYMLEAFKMIIGTIPLLENQKSGQVKDAFAISTDSLGKFLGLLKSSITDAVKIGAVPFGSIETVDFSTNNGNMLDQYNKVTMGQSGTNTRIFYATDKMNVNESKASINADEQLAESIYPYFEQFLNYQINKRTKKYKFKFILTGTEMTDNKKQRLDNAIELSKLGIVLPQMFSSALGLNYHDFRRQLEMAKVDDFVNKYIQPLVSMYQTTNKDNGRPRTDNPTDDTIAGQDAGSNIAKGNGEI